MVCGVLSDSSLFYRCQVIALLNSCQNKFRLFYQFTWRKKSVGNIFKEDIYFSTISNKGLSLKSLKITKRVDSLRNSLYFFGHWDLKIMPTKKSFVWIEKWATKTFRCLTSKEVSLLWVSGEAPHPPSGI